MSSKSDSCSLVSRIPDRRKVRGLCRKVLGFRRNRAHFCLEARREESNGTWYTVQLPLLHRETAIFGFSTVTFHAISLPRHARAQVYHASSPSSLDHGSVDTLVDVIAQVFACRPTFASRCPSCAKFAFCETQHRDGNVALGPMLPCRDLSLTWRDEEGCSRPWRV